MSLEFNRRSFLKYSAAAAVAVAGSSLLVGCGEDEYQKTGKIGSTLKLMGAFKLESASLNSAPATTAADKTLTCLVCLSVLQTSRSRSLPKIAARRSRLIMLITPTALAVFL